MEAEIITFVEVILFRMVVYSRGEQSCLVFSLQEEKILLTCFCLQNFINSGNMFIKTIK